MWRRVRALTGRRMTKQARHAGDSRSMRAALCERRRAARPAEAPAGRTAVLGGSSRQLPAHRGLSNSGHSSTAGRGFAQERMSLARARRRPQSRRYRRSRVASPCSARGRSDRRPVRLDPGVSTPPPGSSELTNHAKPIRGEATRRAPELRGQRGDFGARASSAVCSQAASSKTRRPKRQARGAGRPSATSGRA